MKFHLPSFVFGCVAGASAKALAPRLRPLFLELTTVGYKIFDALVGQAARGREDISDLIAEARARAREPAPTVEAESN